MKKLLIGIFVALVMIGIAYAEESIGDSIMTTCPTITGTDTQYAVAPGECLYAPNENVTITGIWSLLNVNQQLNYGEQYYNPTVNIRTTCRSAPVYNITKVLGRGECWIDANLSITICASNDTLNMTQLMNQLNYSQLSSHINVSCPDISAMVTDYDNCKDGLTSKDLLIADLRSQMVECGNNTTTLMTENQMLQTSLSDMTGRVAKNNTSNSTDAMIIAGVIGIVIVMYFIISKGWIRKAINHE